MLPVARYHYDLSPVEFQDALSLSATIDHSLTYQHFAMNVGHQLV